MDWICPIRQFKKLVYIIYRLTDQVTPTDEIRMIKGVINLKIGYIRVSSVDQNEERQRKALEKKKTNINNESNIKEEDNKNTVENSSEKNNNLSTNMII